MQINYLEWTKMLPKDWMQTPEGKELWDKLFSSSQKKKEVQKNNYIPLVRTSVPSTHKSVSQNILPVSTTSIDSLIAEDAGMGKMPAQTIEPEKKSTLANLKSVELRDIATYFKAKGVVGEESLVTGIYLALSNNISFGVEGYSGSGKTFLVDKLINLVKEEDLYRAELSSKTAMFYDAHIINGANLIYIPELQKALQDRNSPVTEIIKNITEGKDAKRIVTSKNQMGSEEFVIDKGKTIVYTLALENSFKKDNEAARRFMRFITDSTPKHFEEIISYKAQGRGNLLKSKHDEELTTRLGNHLNALRNLSVQVIDPFAEYLQAFIPKTQKSVGYIDHYYNLVDACTRFHFQNREHFVVDNQDYLLANLEDHYQVHAIYYNEFIKTLDDLAQEGESKYREENIDWKKCFEQGREQLYQNSTLQEVVKDNPALLKNWEIRQVGQGSIHAKDYKTGEFSVLVDNITLDEK